MVLYIIEYFNVSFMFTEISRTINFWQEKEETC